jgi:hypothetical protein
VSGLLALEAVEEEPEDADYAATLREESNLDALLDALRTGAVEPVYRSRAHMLAARALLAIEDLARVDRALIEAAGDGGATEEALVAEFKRLKALNATDDLRARVATIGSDLDLEGKSRLNDLSASIKADTRREWTPERAEALAEQTRIGIHRVWTRLCNDMDMRVEAATTGMCERVGP